MKDIGGPALSIAIPTYNRGNRLLPLLQEISNQADAGDDLLLIDDGSKDDTASVAGAVPRFRCLRNEVNLGMVGNWNACLHAARHDWICLIHDDDVLARGGLATLRRACALAAGPAVVAHQPQGADEDPGFRYSLWEPGPWAARHPPDVPSGVAVHRAVIEQVGDFDPQFKYSADIEFFSRAATRFPLLIVQSPAIVHYQVHVDNYQFETWRQPDFYAQYEHLQRVVLQHAGIRDPIRLETLIEEKMVGAMLYIYGVAGARRDRATVRRVCRQLLKHARILRPRHRVELALSALTGTLISRRKTS